MTTPSAMRKSRSRNGCVSCKKLRIKCDEQKPSCEYCVHTKRICEYPDKSQVVVRGKPNPKAKTVAKQNTHNSLTMDSLLNELVLCSISSQLNINRLELRLLSFFNQFCIPLFSFGVDMEIHKVWSDQVPALFVTSPLIRSSIYSFAALNLFPLCDLNQIKDESLTVEELSKRGAVAQECDVYNIDLSMGDDSLYIATTNFFEDTVRKARLGVPSETDLEQAAYGLPEFKAAEMAVSSILIFSFLGIHPHKLMPLVSFDRSEADYISLTGSMHDMFRTIATPLRKGPFKGLFSLKEELETPPTSLKESTVPWIVRLREELVEHYVLGIDTSKSPSADGTSKSPSVDLDDLVDLSDGTASMPSDIFEPSVSLSFLTLDEDVPSPVRWLDSVHSQEYDTLHRCLELIQTLVSRVVHFNYPVPIFRWFVQADQPFRDLIYQQNFFALRMTYAISVIMYLSRLQLYNESNMWIDFIKWFRDYNYEKYGGWRYSLDAAFHTITAEKKHCFKDMNYRSMADLDPEKLALLFKQFGL